MFPKDDYYARLGVEPGASPDEVRQAYLAASRRFQFETNPHPNAQEEFRRIQEAFDVLRDPAARADHDSSLDLLANRPLWAHMRLVTSRRTLPELKEPQALSVLVEISAPDLPASDASAPPVNLCLVIDRSTSMNGERLDQVKASAQTILARMRPVDTVAVVTFSDRAEVVIPSRPGGDDPVSRAKISTLTAGGGTEIMQGLALGIAEVRQRMALGSVNQLTLLTDGRTYGDEAGCLALARDAAEEGIRISCLGIGEEWNDEFLDEVAGLTGGQAIFLDTPEAIQRYFNESARTYENLYAHQLVLRVSLDRGVTCQSAFRLYPEAGPIPAPDQIRPGNLRRRATIGILLQFLLPPFVAGDYPDLARLCLSGRLLSDERVRADVEVIRDLSLPVRSHPPAESAPLEISEALGKLTLYQLQEKARGDVARGDIERATRRLRSLAQHLTAAGESELARDALAESARIENTRQLSPGAAKRLKYGTRALLDPSEKFS